MRTMIPKKTPVLLLASAMMIGASASATTIYDNSVNDSLSRFDTGGNIVGDEINLLPGTSRILTNFSFEFWALHNGSTSGTFTPSIQAQVRFYLNDGPLFNGYHTPGFQFYDSGTFSILNATARSTEVFTAADFGGSGLFMPLFGSTNNFTWSVQFSGGTVGDTAGLDVYNPPVVGSSLNDYWQFSGGSWALLTNTIPMNFAAKFQAGTVPEPSTVLLGIVGGLSFLVVGRRFAKVSS